jgi:hypothetical protein
MKKKLAKKLLKFLKREIYTDFKLSKPLVDPEDTETISSVTILDAYRLRKPIPGLPAGVVFLHDPNDSLRGSIALGCLKLAWKKGNCQRIASELGWCGSTFVFPGQLTQDDEWFEKIDNDGEFHL